MKLSNFNTAVMLGLMVLSSSAVKAESFANLSDEEALELGMTPIEEYYQTKGLELLDLSNRSEFVTSIPSQEDIDNVIRSNKQVIVVNKGVRSKKNPLGQTLRLFQDGQVKPLTYTTTVSKEEVTKEAVDISTGREVMVTAKSGRKYLTTTPKGFFRPNRVYKNYYSATWKADMPNAVFMCQNFNYECGIAIHATTVSHYGELGTRASGGCVRTRLDISKQLREFVMDTGRGSQAGNYVVKGDGTHPKRQKIFNNQVSVDQVSLMKGNFTGKKVSSWDTVIVVYE